MFDQLRTVAPDRPIPDADGLRLPASSIAFIRQAKRLSAAGTPPAAAAKRMNLDRDEYRALLSTARFLKPFAPLKPANCPE